MEQRSILHPIPPVYDGECTVLILGSFPSVRSRESGFFYGHPQNRFWRVMAAVFGDSVPLTIPEKRQFLLSHHVALWDVIASCEIEGSDDSSIRAVVPNDLNRIIDRAPIGRIFVNGKTALRFYNRYALPILNRQAVCLPSTSPANAAWDRERLIEAWKPIRISENDDWI